MVAFATPGGTVTEEAFNVLVDEMMDSLQVTPWDGVLLALHGAAVSANHRDADGEVISRARLQLGADVPIALALDLHANVSSRMIESSTVTTLYRTNPHLDAQERALECGTLLLRTIRGEIDPVPALETPPLTINILRQETVEEPMASLFRALEESLRAEGILTASIAMGYPYADVAEMGMTFLAYHDGNAGSAAEAARALATLAWQRREEMQGTAVSITEALERAARASRHPVVLLDVGDNVGGGSPGDSTVILAAARELGVRSYLQTICDGAAVDSCIAAGLGARIQVPVGGKGDELHGQAIDFEGRVRLIADGRFEDLRPTHGGFRYFDGGPTVVLEGEDDYTLVLTTNPVINSTVEQFYSHGVKPETKQVVVAKGVVSPRPAFTPIAAEIIAVDTPGCTTANLNRLTYAHRRRPLYPFESDVTYD